MKLVGEAVRGTSFGSQIVTIGVTTWGIIKNREQLSVVSISLPSLAYPFFTLPAFLFWY